MPCTALHVPVGASFPVQACMCLHCSSTAQHPVLHQSPTGVLPAVSTVGTVTYAGLPNLVTAAVPPCRLLAHRSFKTYPIVEYMMSYFALHAMQGPPLEWVSNHRCVHMAAAAAAPTPLVL